MSPQRVAAVTRRIVEQFRHDRRSIGLIVVAPLVILTLVGALWGSPSTTQTRVILVGGAGVFADALRTGGAVVTQVDGDDQAREELRAGRADVAVTGSGGPGGAPGVKLIVEGSDPNLTASSISRLQAAVSRAAPGAVRVGEIEYLYGSADATLLDGLAPVLIGFFGYFFMLLLSTVSFQRERASGTLERLMATPLRRGELVLGYLFGFSIFALLQATVIITFTLLVLGVHYRGNIATIFLIEAVLVVGAVSLGLFISAFARNELQAVQFMPLVLVPQVFLSGLLVPVEQLNDVLRAISNVLPLTYANEALRAVMVKGATLTDPLILRDLGILAAVAAIAAAGAVASIRREVA